MATLTDEQKRDFTRRAADLLRDKGLPVQDTAPTGMALAQELETWSEDAHIGLTAETRRQVIRRVTGRTTSLDEEKIAWVAYAEFKREEILTDLGIS